MTRECCHTQCSKRANFNLPGKSPEWCTEHKTSDMIDVNNKKCLAEGCFKIGSYDVPGGFRKYCVEHKKDGMVDIMSKKCAETNCKIQPNLSK